jgi:peptidoglycan hydrolase-like protein with peptidoglycan-binding domain
MKHPFRILVVVIPLVFFMGCRPDPIYVVERVDGGGWVRTLSQTVAQDSLFWQIEEGLQARFNERVAKVQAELAGKILEEIPTLSPEVVTLVTASDQGIPSERLQELLELWGGLERFAIPVDRDVVTGLKDRLAATASELSEPGLLSEDRTWVETEFGQASPEGVVDLSGRLSELMSHQHTLWQKRFLPALQQTQEQGYSQLKAQVLAVEHTYKALELLSRAPRQNPLVKTLPPGDEAIGNLEPPSLQDWVSALSDAGGKTYEDVFRSFIPVHPQFWKLSDAYLHYRDIQKKGGWEKLTSRRTLKVGKRGEPVAALRERLRLEGFQVDVPEGGAPDRFDKGLSGAVKTYQRQHYLRITGQLDEKTRKTLNKTVDERVVEIGTTLWKWRTSRVIDLQEDHIFVNIAGFYGELWREGAPVHPFKVAVGKARRRKTQSKGWHYPNATPELHSAIRHVVMNPTWNIPSRIFKKEILPKLEKDPMFAEKKHYVLEGEPGAYKSAYQTSGPWNALGRVKFIFPNTESVYLHDTPGKRIFKRSYRAASHGCIRVENAMELAKLLLGPERRWRKKYEEEPVEPKEQWIGLKKPVPVILESYRVWVDESGAVYFGSDLYRRERAIVASYTALWADSMGKEASADLPGQDTKR